MCEHHLLPFIGEAHVAYIPDNDGRVTGLSKLARLVDGYARRPQVQERLTTADRRRAMERLEPKGVARGRRGRAPVHVACAGSQKPGHRTITSAVRGVFRTDEKKRLEAFSLMGYRP